MKESNDWQLLASALEARLQRANQLESIDEIRRFVALHELSVDTSGDGRVRGVKSGIKAQILAACRDAIRLLAFQRASELRTMDEMRDFVAEHELPVNTGVRGRTRGVQASVKAQILVALHATHSQHFGAPAFGAEEVPTRKATVRQPRRAESALSPMALAEAKARARAAQLRRCDPPHRCPAAR